MYPLGILALVPSVMCHCLEGKEKEVMKYEESFLGLEYTSDDKYQPVLRTGGATITELIPIDQDLESREVI